MTGRPTNLAYALAEELERIVAKRERWKDMVRRGEVRVVEFLPGLALMTQAIDAAKSALGLGDAIASLRAYEDLKGFASDD